MILLGFQSADYTVIASFLTFAAAGLQRCSIEHAHYALRTQSSVTADFYEVERSRPPPGNLVMRMHIGETGRTYWWIPIDGGSNLQQYLASTPTGSAPGWESRNSSGQPRPLGEVDFIATDAGYKLWKSVPKLHGPAPAHFLIPDLREALWYRTSGDQRDYTARQFFDLVSCSRHKVK
jgi:hypothetical protein